MRRSSSRRRIEKVGPLLCGELEVETSKWAEAAHGESSVPWHPFDQTVIDEHVATLHAAE